jgi:8-amino-7-oxononanoate synthase
MSRVRQPAEELAALRAEGLLRRLRPLDSSAGPSVIRDGVRLWNFASNDYLGLASHPAIRAALIEGAELHGHGAAASRLVCGSHPAHQLFEEELAAAKGTDAALLFPSGFATALGAIPAIVGPGDFVVLDRLSHACLVDGAKLSGATLRVFRHNEAGHLSAVLAKLRERSAEARILVVTESVFSMDGDLCPLKEIVEIAERYEVELLLDEAHAFGVFGPNGMGLAEQLGLQERVTFQMGTLSKAAGLAGGYLAASRPWIDLVLNRARSFIYTTAPPPAMAHAASASLAMIRSAEGASLRESLRSRQARFAECVSPILPVILGTNEAALSASNRLEQRGFLVPAIRFPTVPRNTARLRISLSAAHPDEAINGLLDALAALQA